MANGVSILRNKTQLTVYQHGVTFTLKTPGQDYSIDCDTANKLADLLIAPGDTKFVKVRTAQGQVVLNLSSIMAVVVDEKPVQGVLSFIRYTAEELMKERDLPVGEVLKDKPEITEWFNDRYHGWAVARELPMLPRADFEYYFKRAVADKSILENVTYFPVTRPMYA